MEKRLFVIKNRTHYLIARNYIKNKPQAENYIFLTIRKFQGHKEFSEELSRNPDFKLLEVMITDHNFPVWNYAVVIANILKVKKIASKHKYFDEVIFANYHTWMQHFIIHQFESKRKVLLSDGTRALVVAELRKKDKSINLKSVPFGGSDFVIKDILKIAPIENLHFYSPVKIEVAEGDSLETFHFKSSESSIVDKNKIFFIGSPLVEIEYLTLERQLYYLKKIKEHFKGSEICYLSHRREEKKNLKHYEFFGEIVRNETPFEEKMESEKELPGIIMSFQSSVVMNLPAAYPQIQFYYIPLEEVDLPTGSTFKNNYETLIQVFKGIKEPNFQEIKLSEPVIEK